MPNPTHSFIKNLWSLIVPYWKSDEKWRAYFLLATIIALNLGVVYLDVLFNKWYNNFYNALQAVDKQAFIHSLIRFTYLAVIFIIVAVYRIYLNQMLSIRWRRWLTGKFLDHWLYRQNYYHLQLKSQSTDNPDQRISEDIGQFIDASLGLSLGLLSAVVTLLSFLTILWTLSGPFDIKLAGHAIHIPGYMVWAALIYSILGTWLTHLVGRPLVALNFNQQRLEADFRFSLVRFRENSENIAFYRGEVKEKEHFFQRFQDVFDNFWQIMKRQKRLTWLTSFYGQAAIIFPLVVASPRFFSKQIQLGTLMQISSAFAQVQGSLSFIVDSYASIATWKATSDRLITFQNHMLEAENYAGFHPSYTDSHILQARDLTIRLPSGQLLLNHINLDITPQESLLIIGPSGCGKTTLLRTLAGIWPFATGSVQLPKKARILFLPQKVYLPLGTLKEILYYNNGQDSDEKALEMLRLCKLTHLYDTLYNNQNWGQLLSVGEQQRIGFARAILSKPDFLFLDEATSALDEANEQDLYGLLKAMCPNASVISVGHRASLQQWHTRQWSCADYRAI